MPSYTTLDQLADFIADGYYDNARDLIETWTGGASARLDELKRELIKRRPFIFLPNRFDHLGFAFHRNGGNCVALKKDYRSGVRVQLTDGDGESVPALAGSEIMEINIWHGDQHIGFRECDVRSGLSYVEELDGMFSNADGAGT